METPEVDSIVDHQCSDIAIDVSRIEYDLNEVGITYSKEMSLEETSGADDGEEIGEPASKLDVMRRDSVPFEHPANYSDKQIPDEHVNLKDDVGASPGSVTVTIGANDDVNEANNLSSDLVVSSSSNLPHILESQTGNEGAHQKGLDFSEGAHQKGFDINVGAFPEYCPESEEQREVAPTVLDSSPYELVSDDHSNVDVLEHVHESAIANQTQHCSYISADTVPSPEVSKLDLESTEQANLRHSIDTSEDAVCSTTSHQSEVETSLEHSMELPADQILVGSVCGVVDEANFESLDPQSTSPCHLPGSGLPSEPLLELQSDQLDKGYLQADEASPKTSDLQSEPMQTEQHR